MVRWLLDVRCLQEMQKNLNLKVSIFEFILLTETYVVNSHSVNLRRVIAFVLFSPTLERK